MDTVELAHMNKLDRMIQEFPFLLGLLAKQRLSHQNIGNVTVHRGDKNLLEVRPIYESHDIGEHGDYTRSRQFWFVTDTGWTRRLSTSTFRTQVPHGTKCDMQTPSIGVQMMTDRGSFEALRYVTHIVEISGEDWSTQINTWHVRIYKMEGFDWVSFCRGCDPRFGH